MELKQCLVVTTKEGREILLKPHHTTFIKDICVKSRLAIPCIKFLRQEYTLDLSEAKDLYDTLLNQWVLEGHTLFCRDTELANLRKVTEITR